jgi:hypothetical protein
MDVSCLRLITITRLKTYYIFFGKIAKMDLEMISQFFLKRDYGSHIMEHGSWLI